MENILVTGCAGFIGMHLCKRLLKEGNKVYGIDNLNKYYSPKFKEERVNNLLSSFNNFKFEKVDICNLDDIQRVFKNFKPKKVVNLAAQAGVRYSLKNPNAYVQTNLVGFSNIIEACRNYNVEGFIYASSSSVYGSNEQTPFSIKDRVDNPISLYAATKRSNELIAHVYNHLYGLSTTGLRFFTVYGPWGRPDMAMYLFANKIIKNQEIEVYNDGKMFRDFTFIDDIIDGVISSINFNYPCELFNLGNSKCENLMEMISILEKELDLKAKIKFKVIQPGDVIKTHADIDNEKKKLGYEPKVSIQSGIPKFVDWYKGFHKLK